MKTFNISEVRDNKPFEVFFRHVGWVAGKLQHVAKDGKGNTKIKVRFNSLEVVDSEEFVLPDDRLRMKEQ